MTHLKYFFLLLLFSFSLHGQQSMEAEMVICLADTSHFGVQSNLLKIPQKNLRSVAGTTAFEVEYSDFPSSAKTAFNSAVEVWSNVIISRVPIRINATWESLASGTLASSGATKIFKNFKGNALKDTWYPVALAEAIAGENLNAKEYEINVKVNSNISWSYNTDGTRQAFRYDLKTVILHEIAHGLGFTTSMKLNDNNGTQGQWGVNGNPYIYDLFVNDAKIGTLVNPDKIGNPSTDLKTYLTNNDLFFQIKNESPVEIYAPSTFKAGGSISHLDESAFPKGTDNALMSPQIGAGEINHFPGNIILAILNTIGWPVNFYSGSVITAIEPENVSTKFFLYPNPADQVLKIIIPDLYKETPFEISYFDIKGTKIELSQGSSTIDNTLSQNISELPSGLYLAVISHQGLKQSIRFIKR